MKCTLVLCFVFYFACQVQSLSDDVNRQACIRDSGVNPTFVDRAYNGRISDARELKCYFKCYYENAGYMNSRGEINVDKLRANIPSGISRTMANRAIDLCKTQKGPDACETAYLTQKCLLNNSLKY